MIKSSLGLKEKIGYGFGDAASSMFWKLFSMYLLYFYTDIYGLSPLTVGTMFVITRFWDALIDPFVGVIADRTSSRWGKFRPYLLWFAIPFGIFGILTFTTPQLSPQGKIIYAYITYTLMMMVYSLINVPYASLLGVMSGDGRERTTLSSFRMSFAFGGSIIALALIDPLVNFFNQTRHIELQTSWTYSVAVFSVLAIAFFWLTFTWTRERIKPVNATQNKLSDDIKDLLKNKPWWILLGSGIAALIFNSIRDGAAIFYFKYFIGKKELITLYLVLGQAFNIVGIIFVTPVANRIGKKNTYMMAMVLATLLSLMFYWAGSENLVLIMVLQCLISLCAGSIFPLLWSMYADIADYSEWKTGRRATGLIFSSSSMSQKFGWTLGGALAGWLLAFYGFKANVVQSENALNGIRLMVSIFPAIGTILSVIFIYLYPLSETGLKTISGELEQRRNSTKPVNE